MATSEKTITCVPFLNTRLKPKVLGDAPESYQLYIRVIYESKNTHLPVLPLYNIDDIDPYAFYADEDEYEHLMLDLERMDFETEGFGWNLAREVKNYMDYIKAVIQYEISVAPKRFSLNGLGKRVKLLRTTALEPLDTLLTTKLKSFLREYDQGRFSPYVRLENTFESNYNAISRFIVNKFIKLPEDIKYDIEYYFLLASHNDFNFRVSYGSLVFYRGLQRFEAFLDRKELYDRSVLLKVPLENPYSRLLSLNPPSKPKAFYINKLKTFVREINKKHIAMMG
ncbi:hypothetical protein [Phaeodactylibacter xiamenensis]|jgi:hypothetical protein|uniref:hypothetical protein n=1 Tax=Phaeodactylibacter xiamenensis TaxID=1524460 RepID=UPI0024A9B254|nr:hypothetical protein [Phaeodactylibacter xiamenensis]